MQNRIRGYKFVIGLLKQCHEWDFHFKKVRRKKVFSDVFLTACVIKPGASLVVSEMQETENSGSIPGSGSSPRRGPGNPLWYSCLENPMDRRAWQSTPHGVAKNWAQLSTWAAAAVLNPMAWFQCIFSTELSKWILSLFIKCSRTQSNMFLNQGFTGRTR